MITWRQYLTGDITLVRHGEADPFDGWAEHIEANGRGMATFVIGTKVVAVIGFTDYSHGVGDCFAIVDRESVAGFGSELATMCRARLEQSMEVLGIHRMQSTAFANDHEGCVFLRAVGFKKESVMRCAAPDKSDMYLCVIIEE